MSTREYLLSLNDIKLDDEEIEQYEMAELDEQSLKAMKSRVLTIIGKKNFNQSMNVIGKDLLDGEEIKHSFSCCSYKTIALQTTLNLMCNGAGLYSSDWGINLGVIITNKRIFIMNFNVIYKLLNYKAYYFNEIKSIKHYKDKSGNRIYITPRNHGSICVEVFNDKYISALNYLKQFKDTDSIEIQENLKKLKVGTCIYYGVGIFLLMAIFYKLILGSGY
ncbi:PH domain-containing protein [Clostridium amazonitimonense]|uniref:PH domain-containing protein n=1 Tax=Clostridium amazonitimonense TaxID=1499689 RepID=UPI0005095A77|nr:PH domain-containing protein [Clostridium amazonitimonense]